MNMFGEMGLNSRGVVSASILALTLAGQAAFAQSWYATDSRQPGHDPSMYRDENGYILMSTNNNLAMWTSTDMVKWSAKGQIFNDSPQWLKDAVGGKTDGIVTYIEKLRAELKDAMYMCGARKISDIDRSMIRF